MRCWFCCCNTSTSFEPLSMTFLRFYVCLNNRRLIRCTYAVAVCVLKHVSIYTLPLRVCASERHERNVYFSLIERRLVGWVLVALLEQKQRYGLRMFVNTTVGYGWIGMKLFAHRFINVFSKRKSVWKSAVFEWDFSIEMKTTTKISFWFWTAFHFYWNRNLNFSHTDYLQKSKQMSNLMTWKENLCIFFCCCMEWIRWKLIEKNNEFVRSKKIRLDHDNIAINIVQYLVRFIFSTTMFSNKIIIPFTACVELIFFSVALFLLRN